MASLPPANADLAARNAQTGKVMIGVITVMFLFGFASIPLYRWVCDSIDPGGSAASNGTVDSYENVKVDAARKVNIHLATNINRNLQWEFGAPVSSVTLHPGERKLVKFWAKSNDSIPTVGKAVYDINPPEAGQYFKKIECFCFQEQPLEPGARAELPLVFWFDPEMPAHITDITVAYTFFNMETSRAMDARRNKSASK